MFSEYYLKCHVMKSIKERKVLRFLVGPNPTKSNCKWRLDFEINLTTSSMPRLPAHGVGSYHISKTVAGLEIELLLNI